MLNDTLIPNDIEFFNAIKHNTQSNTVPPIVLYTEGYDEDAFEVNVVFRNNIVDSNTCKTSLLDWLTNNNIPYTIGLVNNVIITSEYFYNFVKVFYPTY